MKRINKVAVLGAGTMGARIAAHFANAGVPSYLLDIVPPDADGPARNKIAAAGLDAAKKSKPAAFMDASLARFVTVGNFEDDLKKLADVDWIIEAVVENLKIKRQLMERIDAVRSPYTIVTTNTSGIPVASIAEGRSEGFRQHFLGTHFFNPPRYLKLLEVIPTPDTLPEVVEAISRFAEYRLGKGVVLAKDTPNFIANRLASVDGAFSTEYILENGYTVEEVDAITGPALGRPKTATFRLLDLVGLDVWEHVGGNLAENIPHDARALRYLNAERGKGLIHTLVGQGRLGNKTKQGFYKEVQVDGKKDFWPLDLQTLEYREPTKPRFPSIGKARDVENLGDRLKLLLDADDRAGELVRALTFHDLAYASACIPEIADTPLAIDNAIRWGFGHQAGPFEAWDMIGVAETLPRIRQAGFEPAPWVDEMVSSGHPTFYKHDGDRKTGVYNPVTCAYEPIERPAGLIILKEEKAAGKVVAKNASASLVDVGDGVACVEFHSKMNAMDDDTFNMLQEALDRAETQFEGLVVGNDSENFSAGANLFMVVMAAQSGMWDQLEAANKKMQDIAMRMRHFPRPVVVAPAGLALGGGAEITMQGSRVVAASELYTGLVEFGAGVIPAGGGTKEMVRRLLNPPMRTKNADALPYLQRIFEQIGFAKVSASAEEARQMGILTDCDRIVMNRDLLLFEAKQEVLHMIASGYPAPMPEKIYAAGRDALAALRVGIYMMKEGNYITEHEALMAGKLAYAMTGGELSSPTWVDQQYILDLEREAFLSLCGEPKTQQRMWNILQTGKPLRN